MDDRDEIRDELKKLEDEREEAQVEEDEGSSKGALLDSEIEQKRGELEEMGDKDDHGEEVHLSE